MTRPWILIAVTAVPALLVATGAVDRRPVQIVSASSQSPVLVGRAPPQNSTGLRVLARSSSFEIDASPASYVIVSGRVGALSQAKGTSRAPVTRSASYEVNAMLKPPLYLGDAVQVTVPGPALASAPNPFSAVTALSFELPRRSWVTLRAFDLAGREVARLADAEFSAGHHVVEWSGASDAGTKLPNGIYIVQLRLNESVLTLRVGLIR